MNQWIKLSSAYAMLLVFLMLPYPASAQALSQNLKPIGQVENGELLRRNIAGTEEYIRRDDPVFKGDVFITSRDNGAILVFNDGTRLEVGSQSEAALGDYEYAHDNSGRFKAHIRVGCLNYQSGTIGKMVVLAPSMVLGAEGPTQFLLLVTQSGESFIIHQAGHIVVKDINGKNPLFLNAPGEIGSATIYSSPKLVKSRSSDVLLAVQECLQYNNLNSPHLPRHFPVS